MSPRRELSRRSILAGAASTAFCASCATQAAAPSRRFIDVHHHFNPPGSFVAPNWPEWSPTIAIEEMDRNGVAAGIGFVGPITGRNAEIEANRAQARSLNEFGAQVRRDFPARFGLFAALPMADVEGSLAEMAHAFDVLEADGLGLITQYDELWLGDARFDPIWREANRRRAVVYVHPMDAPCCVPSTLSYARPPIQATWIEWPMNTARTIFSLMTSGTLRRYPDIRFIFSHGGGVMPLLLERIAGIRETAGLTPAQDAELFGEDPIETFARLRFECAQAYAEANMAALTAVAPGSQILFGTDYNRMPIARSVELFERLSLGPALKRAIAHANAEVLFPRFAA